MATSTRNAPARPSMSAPTPLAGSSTMWASASASSPTTTSAACRAWMPGHDPTPLALANAVPKTLTRQPYSTSCRGTLARGVCDGVGRVGSSREGCVQKVSQIRGLARPLLLCGAALLMAACTRVVGGTAVPAFGEAHRGVQGVNVDTILLDQPRMQAITGAGQHLTVIPTMDDTSPVDI